MSENTLMSYNCILKEQNAQPALCIHATTTVRDLPQILGKAYGDIERHLSELGEVPVGAPFVAYYNMDMEALDIDMGFPVARAMSSGGEIRADELPAGKYATCIHTGPYTDIAQAYEALTGWVQENGFEAVGVTYEFYLNDPTVTAPQDLMTEIRFLLK